MDRTPVFSTKSTRLPHADSVDMISWCPCRLKSHSMDDMQTMDLPVSIRVADRSGRWVHRRGPGVTAPGPGAEVAAKQHGEPLDIGCELLLETSPQARAHRHLGRVALVEPLHAAGEPAPAGTRQGGPGEPADE